MTDLKKRVEAVIDQNKEELEQLLLDLVSHPSTKRHELSAQTFFAGKLKELGAEVDLFEPDIQQMRAKYPGFATDRESYEDSPVLAGTLSGAGGGKSMILSGHMDVVEPGDGDWITGGAFVPQVIDGKIYGRGACDMKSGHACSYMALKALKDAGIKLKGDVTVLATIDEEVGNTGIMSLLDKGYRADGAINTEPTAERITVSSAGSFWYKIHVYGRAAHGGASYFGVNAIYKAYPFVDRIRQWEEERRQELFGKVPFYEELIIPFCAGVNMLHAGKMQAIVPEEAVLEGRVGVSPLEDTEEVMERFKCMMMDVALSDPWTKEHPPLIEFHPCRWISHSLEPDHPLAQTVASNYQSVTGKEAEFNGFKACSDSGTMHRMFGIPTLDFGAGPDDTLHKTNEFISVDSLLNVTKVIATTLIDWCGVVEE